MRPDKEGDSDQEGDDSEVDPDADSEADPFDSDAWSGSRRARGRRRPRQTTSGPPTPARQTTSTRTACGSSPLPSRGSTTWTTSAVSRTNCVDTKDPELKSAWCLCISPSGFSCSYEHIIPASSGNFATDEIYKWVDN